MILVLALAAWIGLGTMYGCVRSGIGVAMFFAIVWVGMRKMRRVTSAPPDPEVADVSDYGLAYVCSVCGLRLKVEVAAHDRPPTHCMEPMVLEGAPGRPPLRPLD